MFEQHQLRPITLTPDMLFDMEICGLITQQERLISLAITESEIPGPVNIRDWMEKEDAFDRLCKYHSKVISIFLLSIDKSKEVPYRFVYQDKEIYFVDENNMILCSSKSTEYPKIREQLSISN